jgi:uncharacterized phage-associated protein
MSIVCFRKTDQNLKVQPKANNLVSMAERTPEEAILDRLLLLYVVARNRERGHNILGQIKLQKLLYKTQERMYLSGCKGLNYNFIRWKFGPFSQEIYSDVRDLKVTGFLNPQDAASASMKGQHLLKKLGVIFDRETVQLIDGVINEFGAYSGRQIKSVTYSFPKVGEKKTIEEAELGDLLLTKLNEKKAKKCIRLDERVFDTLRFLFDPSAHKAIQEGLEALKTEKCRPFTPVDQ